MREREGERAEHQDVLVLQRGDARAAIQEAVTIRRRLAQARPDAFLPDLAMSLYNLALMHDAGAVALARAREAVSAYAVLADRHGDVFLGDLRAVIALARMILDQLDVPEEGDVVRRELDEIEQRLGG